MCSLSPMAMAPCDIFALLPCPDYALCAAERRLQY
jgi:hypothetical protein